MLEGASFIREIRMYTRVCYVVQVCQSLEAGRWLEEEKFEMTDCFPAAQVFTPLISVCFIMGCVHSVTSKGWKGPLFTAQDSSIT